MRLPLPTTLLLVFAATAAAQTVPTGFTIDTLVSAGLATPNDCCFLPDGRCLIANSAGGVSLYAGTSATAIAVGTVPNVSSGGEQGLLSIAADPAFPTNGYVYVYYTASSTAFVHVDRFTCTGDLANPSSTNLQFAAASRTAILGALPDNAGNHNGGSLRFGPDGKLWITIGDDANACNAQLLTSQAGCMLRLDVSGLPATPSTVLPAYSALDPGDNPNSAANDFSQLVVAHGLRNPFRAEIDPLTGNVYIGDVGAGSIEEYSEYVHPGSGTMPLVNFGWPWREGSTTGSSCGGTMPAGLVNPIGEVSHGNGWAAVMGGALYRNLGGAHDFGAAYEGNAFFLDYYAGELRRLVKTTTWGPAPAVPGQPSATNWGSGFGQVTSLRLGPDGGLWFTQHSNQLRRLRLIGPVPSVTAVSGSGQRVAAGEAFPTPVVARVFDPSGNPLANGQVNFAVTGAGTLTSPAVVTADANGYAQATVAALTTTGGAVNVTATTPGAITQATFALFTRKITATPAANFLVLSIVNQTTAGPATVPYVVMLSFPGSPTLPTPIGNLCIDPNYALAVVIEDGTGMFNFVSFSGTGGTGTPNLTKLYTLPPGLFTG
ncbi:MAG: PQQ-dependent sugar dehydrogenase, partial [Planctomycetes bacterium]|nr:PQQ-dependent sugar dehydrogenase [Planctomycetota bacterium]